MHYPPAASRLFAWVVAAEKMTAAAARFHAIVGPRRRMAQEAATEEDAASASFLYPVTSSPRSGRLGCAPRCSAALAETLLCLEGH